MITRIFVNTPIDWFVVFLIITAKPKRVDIIIIIPIINLFGNKGQDVLGIQEIQAGINKMKQNISMRRKETK